MNIVANTVPPPKKKKKKKKKKKHINKECDVNVIQCVPEKRKPINQVNFSENCNDLSEKVYIKLQNSVYPLSFDISYKMYWPCMANHEPFQMVMSKLICAE